MIRIILLFFNIPSVRLGIGTSPSQGASIVNKNIKIENLKVTLGVKYKLNISLVPVDTLSLLIYGE